MNDLLDWWYEATGGSSLLFAAGPYLALLLPVIGLCAVIGSFVGIVTYTICYWAVVAVTYLGYRS